MVFITYKVLNLLLRHNRLRPWITFWNCLWSFSKTFKGFHSSIRYCSIFKVLRAAPQDSLLIITRKVLFVKHFFELFFGRSFKLLPAAQRSSRCLADSLLILPPKFHFVNTFFYIFLEKSSFRKNNSCNRLFYFILFSIYQQPSPLLPPCFFSFGQNFLSPSLFFIPFCPSYYITLYIKHFAPFPCKKGRAVQHALFCYR